jgi:hypothetical protein
MSAQQRLDVVTQPLGDERRADPAGQQYRSMMVAQVVPAECRQPRGRTSLAGVLGVLRPDDRGTLWPFSA